MKLVHDHSVLVPGPWVALLLALAAYRISRLVGWDDLPPVVRWRAWLVGEEVTHSASTNQRLGLTDEEAEEVVTHRRPTLNHFIHCAFCSGFWTFLPCYLAWLLAGRWALLVLLPFAGGAAVGLIAKNLDP